MRILALFGAICIGCVIAPPVNKPQEKVEETDTGLDQLMYNRYLQEIVNILEKDPEFRKKLENSNSSHIKSNEFAMELDFVNHQVRQELDEAKRREVKRLTDLFKKRADVEREAGHDKHLDMANQGTFEIEDLQRLIKKTTDDLENIDKKRKEEFKTYEMQKEHKRKEELKGMDEEHRKEAEKKHNEEMAKHKDHPKLHHPGSKDQFKDVWQEDDGLDPEDFNVNTFFKKHDINSDGFWSEEDVEALFQVELEKLYESNHTEDDLNEKYEEMYRMREHLVNEIDKNQDKMISMEEYMVYVKSKEFEKNEGWEGIDESQQYTDEEFAEYERMLAEQEVKNAAMGAGGHAQPGEINIPHDDNVKEMDKGHVPT